MSDYTVVARNFSEVSENRIHSDEIARKFGFKGALVPGVAVYGHLTWPLVQKFGTDWLTRSVSAVRLLSPAYHNDRLTLSLAEAGGHQTVQCHNADGDLLATLESDLEVPEPEHIALLDGPLKDPARVEIGWNTVQERDVFTPWHYEITEEANRTYTEQVADTLPVFNEFAHPHLLLSLANTALMNEYVMPTWIHVGSETRHRAALRVGDSISVRPVTLEKWQKKGHEFIRIWVSFWRGDELTTDILHTAIFKVAA